MSTTRLSGELARAVVIDAEPEQATGAQALAPDYLGRRLAAAEALPPYAFAPGGSLTEQVGQFLSHQAELLDLKRWSDYIALFADDGVYWMPAMPSQTEWTASPSIFAEDTSLMEIRMRRLQHPNAWSQAPDWGMSHVLGNVVIEAASDAELVVRSRFHALELRRDAVRTFAGRYRHTLARSAAGFRIRLQRVDLLTAQAPYEYVLQAWL